MNYIQAVIKISAKRMSFDSGFQRLISCRDNALVYSYRTPAPDSTARAFLENAEDFGLGRQIQLSYLVQKQSPLMGFFEFADAPVDAGSDALFNTEKLRFH